MLHGAGVSKGIREVMENSSTDVAGLVVEGNGVTAGRKERDAALPRPSTCTSAMRRASTATTYTKYDHSANRILVLAHAKRGAPARTVLRRVPVQLARVARRNRHLRNGDLRGHFERARVRNLDRARA
jgi:hypothetical protein